ncbi:AfsR/SARP family transcriptional regulator [Streptomyces sp. URMC 123]|uniref:AfsR/SARP family transcriptional regulator n=1 Tax=Streptomyces sp. URMC 123 TaxID=3423403 RepID=UPI003F1A029E
MYFSVLGPLTAATPAGLPVDIPEPKVRALLAALLVHAGRTVSADRLVDDLWGERLPRNPVGALHTKVSRLRRALARAEPGADALVESRPPGYVLRVGPADTDAGRFAAATAAAYATDDPRARADLLTEALALWRGEALADLGDMDFARTAAARLEEQRLTALEALAEARLDLGEHHTLLGELGELTVRHPLRERLRAVQLRALYRAGRQSEALAVYAALRRQLADELGVDPGPELAALHQAILEHDAALRAPSSPAPGRGGEDHSGRVGRGGEDGPGGQEGQGGQSGRIGHSGQDGRGDQRGQGGQGVHGDGHSGLSAPLTDLIGRARAVPAIRALLGAHRLVTLTGSGGVGKTRLAEEVARQVAGGYPDGVRMVALAGSTAVAEQLSAALGVREEGAVGLEAALRPRRLLLLLDNCEHVVESAAETVRRALAAAPGLSVLATSREPLGLAGEAVWTVPPLSQADAERLFAVRAAAAAPGYAVTGDDPGAVATICRRLDRIPLALELAATRVRALGVREISARLDDRFRLLAGGHRGVPPRQRTLRAVIDWSWELLADDERALLRRLAVFTDGCTLEAAETVCGGGGLDVLDPLIRLVDRSLVTVSEADGGPAAAGLPADGTRPRGPRYRLPESIALYARERLAEAGEIDALERGHHAYFTELAERAAAGLHGPDQQNLLALLDGERANLRDALERAVLRKDAVGALRLALASAWYWFLRGRLSEARRSLEETLRIAGDAPAALRSRAALWHAGFAVLAGEGGDRTARVPAFAPVPVPESGARAGTDDRTGSAARDRTRAAPGGRTARASADGTVPTSGAGRTADELAGGARELWFLGHALLTAGEDLPRSEALVDRALHRARAAGDTWATAAALSTRATQALLRGNLSALRRAAEESHALFEELGDRWGRLRAGYPLAALAQITGDYAHAARLHQDGLRLAEELGLWTDAADRLTGLGRVALLTGDVSRADELHRRAMALAAEHGYAAGEVHAGIGLALAARRAGDLDLAERRLRTALDWHRAVEFGPGPALLLAELGFVAERRGDAAEALSLHRQGLAVARDSGDPRAVALAHEGLAGAHALAGEPALAARLLGAAARAREAAGAPLPEAERGDVDRVTAAVLAALGPEAFAEEFSAGPGEYCPELRELSADVPEGSGARG